MDMITLAMAKAYTDEKVGEGGGSGGGLPTVDFTTTIFKHADYEDTPLTAEESAKLTEATEGGKPCFIRFTFENGVNYVLLCLPVWTSDAYYMIGGHPIFTVSLTRQDAASWAFCAY